jgi:rSAM/selenodomain-associated transferase 1
MNHLLVFAKRPIYGRVKSRLAEDLGKEKALEIYKYLLEHTVKVSSPGITSKWTTHWFWDEVLMSKKTDALEYLLPNSFFIHSQVEGDLGKRMEIAFSQIFKKNKDDLYLRAVIIGSDCLELKSDILITAFEKLETCDIIIGPALDGGYYLLGMKILQAELFHGIEWSSSSVFSSTMEKIQSLNLSVYELPTLRDIDRALDLKNTNIESLI